MHFLCCLSQLLSLVSVHLLWICVAMCWITWWASREELAVPGAGSSSAGTEAFDMSGQNLIDLLQRRGVGDEGDREFPAINGD